MTLSVCVLSGANLWLWPNYSTSGLLANLTQALVQPPASESGFLFGLYFYLSHRMHLPRSTQQSVLKILISWRSQKLRQGWALLQLNWIPRQLVVNEASHFSDLPEILNFIPNKMEVIRFDTRAINSFNISQTQSLMRPAQVCRVRSNSMHDGIMR